MKLLARHLLLALLALLVSVACGGGRAYSGAAESTAPAQPMYDSAGSAPVTVSASATATAGGYAPSRMAEASPPPSQAEPDPSTRPGLATQWGEHRRSVVRTTPFVRADPSNPTAVGMLHYNDASGSLAQVALRSGRPSTHLGIGHASQQVVVSLVDEYGTMLPAYHVDGRAFVVGQPGARYAIRIENRSPYRFEAVLSVDGLDVVDGREASFHKRGYLVAPGASLLVEGFRTSEQAVAAFRFGSVASSYAAQSTGSARNVGVVGVALFAEQGVQVDLFGEAMVREQANPFPGRFAAPPPRGY